jgi:hypothetical protein
MRKIDGKLPRATVGTAQSADEANIHGIRRETVYGREIDRGFLDQLTRKRSFQYARALRNIT